MDKQTISFRMDAEKVSALDTLAEALERDRSYLLNEAVANYLEVQSWQIEHIKSSLRQADAGQFVGHEAVKKMTRKWKRE